MNLIAFISKFFPNPVFLKKIINSTFLTMLIYLIIKRIQIYRKKAHKRLVFKPTAENKTIVNALEPLDYIPAFFLPTFLSQGLYDELIPSKFVKFKREYIVNPSDNGLISLDWAVPKERVTKSNKLLILIHGLSGGSESVYIRDIAYSFVSTYSVVVIHARGINDTPLHVPILYHAGFTTDIKFALNYIKNSFSFEYVFMIGISMGANLSYKFLANDRSFDNYITGYMNLSNFFNQLAAVIKNYKSLVDFVLLKGKKGYLTSHKDMILSNKNIDVEKALNSTSVRNFDSETLVKMHGFEDFADYYSKTESGPDIDKLKNIKTMILVAKDDPIVHLFPKDINKSKFLCKYINI